MGSQEHNMVVLGQIVKHIPKKLIEKLKNKHKIQTRSFSATSHVIAMIFAQLSHALSLNDICDCLRFHKGYLAQIRDSVPPSRNGLAHANATRDAELAEDLFWAVLGDIKEKHPQFHIRWSALSGAAVEVQASDPCGGFHDDSAHCEMHELGEASGAESGGENAPGSGFEVLSAEFCHREPGQELRSKNGVGSLRADSRRRNRRFRQSLRGLCPSASSASPRRNLGYSRQGQHVFRRCGTATERRRNTTVPAHV